MLGFKGTWVQVQTSLSPLDAVLDRMIAFAHVHPLSSTTPSWQCKWQRVCASQSVPRLAGKLEAVTTWNMLSQPSIAAVVLES